MEGGLRKQLWASGASVRMAEQMDQGDGPIVPELQTRLFTLLARTLLDAGEPVEPPSQLITDWVHEKKSKLIEVWAGIKPEDPHYQNLYDHPIQAIILYSKLCQNWWCGAAAVCIFELLATKFGGVRVWAQRHEIEYEEALRDMTNGIMYAHRNGASMWPNRLNAEDESGGSIKVISTTLGGLLDQGVPRLRLAPFAHRPARRRRRPDRTAAPPRRPHHRGGAHVLCQRPDRQGSHQGNQRRDYPARRLQDGGGVQVVCRSRACPPTRSCNARVHSCPPAHARTRTAAGGCTAKTGRRGTT